MSRQRRPSPSSSARRYEGWSRYLAFLTVGITVLVALIALLTPGSKPGDLKLLIEFCIALVAIGLRLQLEMLFRITERARMRDQHGKLLEVVEEHPELLPFMTRTAQASVATLRTTRIERFKDHVPSILLDAQVRMEELAQGRIRTFGGDKTLLLSVFAETKRVIQGTTDEGDTDWWRQAIGKQFLALNKDVINQRKGIVERVWILEARPSEATCRLLEEHHKANVRVFVVRSDELDDQLLVNMTMMDGIFLHEDVTNKLRHAGEYLFSENSADLARAMSRYEQIKGKAEEYEGPESLQEILARP